MRLRGHRASSLGAWVVTLAGVTLGAVALAGCGEVKNTITPDQGSANEVSVMLSGPPNGFYVGLYEAKALGYFAQTDMHVHIEVPTAGQDPVQMLHNGKVLIAIASTPTVLLHRNQDEPVVGVAALVHAPLASIKIAAPPNGGAGLTTTSTTAAFPPSTATTSTSALTATTQGAVTSTDTTATPAASTSANTTTTPGASTTTSTTTTPGTGTSTSTTATTTLPQPDAALWPGQAQQLLDAPGAPNYDGLVVVARKDTILNHAGLLRRFVQALARGYRAARADPSGAAQNLVAQVPSLASNRAFALATVRAAIPYVFPAGMQIWGWQHQSAWNTLGQWMMNHNLISIGNAITDASTNQLLQGEGV